MIRVRKPEPLQAPRERNNRADPSSAPAYERRWIVGSRVLVSDFTIIDLNITVKYLPRRSKDTIYSRANERDTYIHAKRDRLIPFFRYTESASARFVGLQTCCGVRVALVEHHPKVAPPDIAPFPQAGPAIRTSGPCYLFRVQAPQVHAHAQFGAGDGVGRDRRK